MNSQTPDNEVQFPWQENCPQVSNYCDKHLRSYSIGSPWHGVIRLAFNLERELTEKINEVARLCKYVEKLEIYSPENEWSQPEWRKLIGSKEEHEDPETLFRLYQFRLAPAPEESTIGDCLTVEPVPDDLHAWMRLQEEINREVVGELRYLHDEIQKFKKN